jgi:C4-dicarboxylate transporter/malic acid transport protein
MNKPVERSLVRHFSPAWYASVMGTGGLANALYLFGAHVPFLRPVATALWLLNIILFIVLIGPWSGRWFLHFDKLIEDLRHPIMSNFFVTMPVGALVLGTNFFLMGRALFPMHFIASLGVVLWTFAVVLILFFGVVVTYNMFVKESMAPEDVNFSWFISPVASIAVPLLGNLLARYYAVQNANAAQLINLVDISFYGIGMSLFFIIGSIVVNSLLHHRMPHAKMAPTFWIILGPVGVGTISLMGIADVSKLLGLIESTSSVYLASIVLWGFGLWAFPLTLMISARYMREADIPFSLTWWAYIFPLAVYAMSAYSVAGYLHLAAIFWYAAALCALLALLWIVVFTRSLVATFAGELLIPGLSRGKNPGKAS